MGEVTAGGAHPSRGFKISNQVVAVVPYARLVSPITRGNLERSGVIPDVAVPAAQTQQTAYRSGVQALIARAANEGEAAGLRARGVPGNAPRAQARSYVEHASMEMPAHLPVAKKPLR
ncbi:hypothetical protein VDS20_03930 [Xanthomonas campestris pv. campestris]|nr:hypothetical protein [Xanthomonas campestris pv. campestris]